MPDLYNIYCDESCHLERDHIKTMVIGAIWCKAERSHAIARRIRDIKLKHDLSANFEIKWTKISPAKSRFYSNLIEYFFDEDDLHFRGVIIPDNGLLDHAGHKQSHNDWYYKMCFTMLEPIIDPRNKYLVYLDIKDTRGVEKCCRLLDVLRSSRHDLEGNIVDRVQQINSRESNILQLGDLLIGAIGYHNRGLSTSLAKREMIQLIQSISHKSLDRTTWLREPKLNLLRWQADGGET
jgi:hypothetical protein